MNQPGYYFGELLHQDPDCAIHRNTARDCIQEACCA